MVTFNKTVSAGLKSMVVTNETNTHVWIESKIIVLKAFKILVNKSILVSKMRHQNTSWHLF